MTFPAACLQFHDQHITAHAFYDFLLHQLHIWDVRLRMGFFSQIVAWCGGA